MLKKYLDNQKEKEGKPLFEQSGIACDEKSCTGEMLIPQPVKTHPTLTLKRVECGKCSWLGWV